MRRLGLLLAATAVVTGCTASSGEVQPLQAKAAIIAEYDPGTCYGMPTAVPEELMDRTMEQNTETVSFIRDEYETNSTIQVYQKIEQFNAVTLEEAATGYEFTVEDGNCCAIHTYTGTVQRDGDDYRISETGNSTETVPC